MTQTIQFNENGLGEIKIGTNLSALDNIGNIEDFPKRKNLRLWFDDEYKYYYIKDSTLKLKNVGPIKEIFIVPDKSGNVIAITVYVIDQEALLAKEISNTFGEPKLNSESSIDSNSLNSKFFWKSTTGISVFLTTYANSIISKIAIYRLDINEHTPGVSLTVQE